MKLVIVVLLVGTAFGTFVTAGREEDELREKLWEE